MKVTLILMIICLILVLCVIGAVYYAIYRLKQKTRQFSRQVFGTESLKEGFDQIEAEYAATPKSVSAMTSLFLPRITKDFPEFSYDEMKKKAQNVLTSYLLAIHEFNPGRLTEGNSELKNKLEHKIVLLKNKEQREYFDNIKIHRTEISGYTKKSGRCIITMQTSVQYYHYITDSHHNVISGSKDVLFQSRYETDLIYIQDRSLVENDLGDADGLNCPNCGAPITNLGAKFCEYCGTGVVAYNIQVWSFSDVREQ